LGSNAAPASPFGVCKCTSFLRRQQRHYVLYVSFKHRFSCLIFFLRLSNKSIFRRV
jgi:hypothetical protein